MTPAQLIALQRIAGGDCHPQGRHNVRVVRVLVELGYVTLEDCGKAGKSSSERWFAELTPKGREMARRGAP
jgi:hypothetical protein